MKRSTAVERKNAISWISEYDFLFDAKRRGCYNRDTASVFGNKQWEPIIGLTEKRRNNGGLGLISGFCG